MASITWPLGDDPRADASTPASPPTVVGVADLRATNAAAVLAAVRSAARPLRLASLAEATRLSRPTVEVLVDDLIACGLIEEAPAAPTRGLRSPGRPARRYQFQPRAGFVLGVDVRAQKVSACVADLDGQRVTTKHRSVRADLTGRARANAVADVVRGAIAQAEVSTEQICAATVGTPGLIARGNTGIRYVDNLKGWAEADIVGVLGDLLGCPVAVENDANLAALGEHWRGVGASTSEMIFILLSERLGAGIITGGRLLRGHHGAAGEIGFIYFPGRSTSEPPGLGSMFEATSDGPTATKGDAFIARAAQGDPESVAALEAVGRRLAEGIAPVLLALDPAVVVIGTSLFGEPHLSPAAEALLKAAEQRATSLLVDRPDWRLSVLSDDAILIGAVRFALAAVEHVLRTRPTSLFAPGRVGG